MTVADSISTALSLGALGAWVWTVWGKLKALRERVAALEKALGFREGFCSSDECKTLTDLDRRIDYGSERVDGIEKALGRRKRDPWETMLCVSGQVPPEWPAMADLTALREMHGLIPQPPEPARAQHP